PAGAADDPSSGPTGPLPARWPGPHLPNFPIPEIRVCSNNELVSFQQSRKHPASRADTAVLVNLCDAARGATVLDDRLAGACRSPSCEGRLRSTQEGFRAVEPRLSHHASPGDQDGVPVAAPELRGGTRGAQAAQLLGTDREHLATGEGTPDDWAVSVASVVPAAVPEQAGRDDDRRVLSIHHWMRGGGVARAGPRTMTRRPSTKRRPSANS